MSLDFSTAPSTQAAPPSLSFEEVAGALRARTLEVCRYLLPGGRVESGEYRVGDISGGKGKSLGVNLAKAAWKDFASGQPGGDLISLWAAVHGVDMATAKDQAAEWLGIGGNRAQVQPVYNTPPEKRFQVVKSDPVRRTLRPGDIVYRYETPDGQPYLDVVRTPDKAFHQWTPLPDGQFLKGAPPAPRHLYNLRAVLAAQLVIVVEGEKCADAINAIGYIATTCVGGASGVKMSDWSPLRGKDVIAWRDNDEPGKKWLASIEATLKAAGARSLRVVS